MTLCYHEGQFRPLEDTFVPLSDLAVQRGIGVFESIRTYDRRPIAPGPHLERLARSAEQAGIRVFGIVIDGDRVSFQRADKAVSARYAADGYEILTYAKGNRGVRFIFKKTEGDAEAPGFIQFSDHKIAPEAADHYHLYWGDDRAGLLKELTNWPTYYPAALSPQQVADEMMAH